MASSLSQIHTMQQVYGSRASTYDSSWHVQHAADFVKWANIRPGQRVLDLACGTGLVTIPAAKAVGSEGSITGIDITAEMLEVGRGKAKREDLPHITFLEHDIADLAALELDADYDAITCASALPLLHNPGAAIAHWATFLKPGGLLAVDVPIEHSQLPGLVFEKAVAQVGEPIGFGRLWVTGPKSLESRVAAAGLRVEHSFVARGYGSATTFHVDEAEALFDKWIRGPFVDSHFAEDVEKRTRARKLFVDDFKSWAGPDGVVREEEGFYVVVGKKI